MNSDELRKEFNKSVSRLDSTIGELEAGHDEVIRVSNVIANTEEILNDFDEEFCKATQLTRLDMEFLFVAIGLQIARQYLVTQFPERLDDKDAADGTKGHGEEHSDRKHQYYKPTLEEVITNPVPFDANVGANGALSGGGKMGHRVTAIGHDPILGLIFGTANIATSTLTNCRMASYHITTQNKKDTFKCTARTDLVLKFTMDKMINEGLEGKKIVAASLLKEIIHLKSDINTKHSLPLPFVSVINPELASKLASYGLDMANVTTVCKQISYSSFINAIIAMLHGMFYDGTSETDEKLFETRTRKILSYSNLVATSSNIAVVGITGDMKKMDLGGSGVTIYRLITDSKFIREVKEEFIFGSYKDLIIGDFPSN